ncbi:MAG: VWA domain-containing protein [Ignavibacteriae bacterium]|nr:VWA domain-containing protein [Ignavibacteriota bacterium]MCB9214825.1 VWA domain-containing protein [Ignavibacteria bacterium]
MKRYDLLSFVGFLFLMILSSLLSFSCANTNDVVTGKRSGGSGGSSNLHDNPLDVVGTRSYRNRKSRDNSSPLSAPEEPVYMKIPLHQNLTTIYGDTEGAKENFFAENSFRAVESSPLSTFSIDVDAASYTNIRSYLSRDKLPPTDAVRIEELVNYFKYDYEEPRDEHPFSFATEVSDCPWNSEHKLVRVALQGREIHPDQVVPSNIVFLIDVSGSMSANNKLPLLKESFYKLVDAMGANDRIAIVVYAGAAGLVLNSTSGSKREKIKKAIEGLKSGGSTAGGDGITLAYKVAKANFLKEGNNRVILATDGDFNVGVSSQEGLVKLIEEKRAEGIYLSVLGFGDRNYQDVKMEQLADNGNGDYYYIDRLDEGERVLVRELSGTLHTIAKDVKLQIEFNPEKVSAYRLLGYENRVLTAVEFDNDMKDAGELGAGHNVTAFYEVVLKGANVGYEVDTTKLEDYRLPGSRPDLFTVNDLMIARLRYKNPKDSVSNVVEHLVVDERKPIEGASDEFRFATAVVEWGLLLRKSDYVGKSSYDQVINLAVSAIGSDERGYRKEFVKLVEKSRELSRKGLSTR